MDETYQDYINRVAQLVLPANHELQIQNIQQSPKFESGKAVSFPGYSVITPPGKEDTHNTKFYQHLILLQQQLSQELDEALIVPLPPESFHLTLADLIWDSIFRQAVTDNPEFETDLRKQIQTSFEQYKDNLEITKLPTWQLLGLTIRPRAILACLVPQDRESYQPIVQLRRSIYQNAALIGLGIEQQYDFTAHITLGYFGEISNNNLDRDWTPSTLRDRLKQNITQINDQLLETSPQVLTVERVELRKFDTMVHYYREPDWATISWSAN